MYDLSKFENSIKKIGGKFAEELGGLRTGRANPALIKDVAVDYYGSKMKLEGLSSIAVQDARTLIVQPWDKNSLEPIEKAIRASNLGLQPVADKDVLRIILPELTGERRQVLLKLLGEKLEDSRIVLRRERDEVWKDIQVKERGGEISEDEKFRLKEELQKRVDKFNNSLQDLADKKRQEISS